MEREYELMVIARSDISDESRDNIFSKISKRIEELSGKINSAGIWARERTFAYPLRSPAAGKKKFNKGCYWLVNFILDTKEIVSLKETIKLEENILRSIIIKRSK